VFYSASGRPLSRLAGPSLLSHKLSENSTSGENMTVLALQRRLKSIGFDPYHHRIQHECLLDRERDFARSIRDKPRRDRQRDPSGGTLIYLMTMNPPIGGSVAGRPNIESYNDIYRDLAATMAGVDLIDVAPGWAGATTTEIPDNIHPTLAAQNSILVLAMVAALNGVIT
jgi:hypothetical protein